MKLKCPKATLLAVIQWNLCGHEGKFTWTFKTERRILSFKWAELVKQELSSCQGLTDLEVHPAPVQAGLRPHHVLQPQLGGARAQLEVRSSAKTVTLVAPARAEVPGPVARVIAVNGLSLVPGPSHLVPEHKVDLT